jgi:hypothetical protein
MEHNLITRYREYLRRREEYLRLQMNLDWRPTQPKIKRSAVMLETLTALHQSVMAAIYDRTRHYTHRYKLDSLVARFKDANRHRTALNRLKMRYQDRKMSELVRTKIERLTAKLDPVEQELMADAIREIDRIFDLESRNE